MHRPVLTCLFLLVAVGPLFGQGTVTDGSVSYSFKIETNEFDNGDLLTTSGADDLFEAWWYLRLGSDGFEFRMRNPDTESYVGQVATLGWSDVDFTGRIDAELMITVTDLGGGTSARLEEELLITNTSGAPLTVNVFGYADLDLTNESVDDSAVLLSAPSLMRVSDSSTSMRFEGIDPDAFQVTETQVAGTLRDRFADGIPDDLDDSGLPFGPADWEGAFQWLDVVIPAGGSFLATTIMAHESLPFFEDGFETGDTSMWDGP